MVIIKIIRLFLLCIVFTFSFSFVAKASYTSEEFQESLFEIGYKSIYEALNEGNEYFNQEIVLPVQLPPVAFTHSFGRFENLDGEVNDKYDIEYVNKDTPHNHYKISIQPVKYGIDFRGNLIDQRIKLSDGNEAIYSTKAVNGFNVLVFEKDKFQYILSVDKRISDIATHEILAEIANSIK
ncbi:hypothetical protein [Sutcliffiella horikoshii]|uniref:hypothetical protein n=1 Tax=Sutcliffiella horikoshii TaxID=79883 RepID=UPI00384E777F